MIAVFVVAEIRLYCEGLARAIAAAPGLTVAGTASSPADVAAALEHGLPDAVLIDTSMGEAGAVVGMLRALAPAVPIVGLSVPPGDAAVIECAEAGLAGYVARDGSIDDLVRMVRAVTRGELPVSPRIAAQLMRRVGSLAAQRPPVPPEAHLTARELQIVELIDEGLSNKEIAVRLGIELATVKKHVHNVLEKLHVRRRIEAAAWVRRSRSAPLRIVGSQ